MRTADLLRMRTADFLRMRTADFLRVRTRILIYARGTELKKKCVFRILSRRADCVKKVWLCYIQVMADFGISPKKLCIKKLRIADFMLIAMFVKKIVFLRLYDNN